LGHVEAKAAEKACDNYRLAIDLIRIAKFNKDAIDNMKMASELGVQVVGLYILSIVCKCKLII
jgi:hypothetical protein